ncbi:MAG: aminotransferase class IV [Bacteroidia bacterium]|jgi:branched-subunit amino acid aminotransferase/4-amino-4-deoxychorismate lyase|nr:aminotransferase class IV [Bacteroidia bacterium]GIV23656.1 MAG: 4-amino-4-deoxychorismate lyase [Bacteroidia bacterium]
MWLHYVNGSWQETLPPGRGSLFGDGVFETLHIYRGKVLFLTDHLRRLRQALQTLHLNLPFPIEALAAQVQALAAPFERARLKLIVQRAGEGTYMPPSTAGEVWAFLQPLADALFPLGPAQRVVVFPTPFLTYTPWSRYKTLSALGYVQAAAYAQAHRCDDALVLSTDGGLAETTRANLFFWDGAVLRTPSLRSGCIAGILRTHILRLAATSGIPTEEGTYPIESLATASEVFTTNVLQGIRPVLGVIGQGSSFRTGPDTLAAQLAHLLRQKLL